MPVVNGAPPAFADACHLHDADDADVQGLARALCRRCCPSLSSRRPLLSISSSQDPWRLDHQIPYLESVIGWLLGVFVEQRPPAKRWEAIQRVVRSLDAEGVGVLERAVVLRDDTSANRLKPRARELTRVAIDASSALQPRRRSGIVIRVEVASSDVTHKGMGLRPWLAHQREWELGGWG